MYIAPKGAVKLMHTGLPSDYTDTIYFDSTTEQFNYFNGLPGTWLREQSYTRPHRGVFRCSLPMSQTYDVDYIMFRNTDFENKWFYAFVNKVTYQNNGLCLVYFTIDTIQTWFIAAGGQRALGECFVSREHVTDDSIGANIEAESVSLGEYVAETGSRYIMLDDLFDPVIILAGVGSGKPNGKLYNGVYGGATLYAFNQGDAASVNTVIDTVTRLHGSDNGIVGLYMAPKIALPDHTVPAAGVALAEGGGSPENVELNPLSHEDGFNGYVPKNNKLYTYPYNFLRITTGQGSHADYPYEYFDGGKPTFKVAATLLAPVTAICLPINYKHFSDQLVGYAPEAITISNYPQCSWSNDVYAAWVAQNSVPMQNLRQAYEDKANVRAKTLEENQEYRIFGQAANAILNYMGVGDDSILGTSKNAISQQVAIWTEWNNWASAYSQGKIDLVTGQMNAEYSAAMRNNNVYGSSTGNITLSMHDMRFSASRWHLRDQRIREIDQYFSMFGYATNKVKVPTLVSRPHWNYIQTIDANVKGNMPADDRELIKGLFEKGVRFWHNGSELGNYELDNSPA